MLILLLPTRRRPSLRDLVSKLPLASVRARSPPQLLPCSPPPAPHPYWATAPIARRSSQLASRPRRDNAPPFNTGRLPPMPTRGVMPQVQHDFGFIQHNFGFNSAFGPTPMVTDPPTRPDPPARTDAQYSAAFLIANFSGFLTSLNLLLASFPPNHPDAIHHQTLREDARLLEAWFSSHCENFPDHNLSS